MTTTKPRLGYIGMGLMGAPMTRRLLEAGYQVAVWNRSADKAKPLAEKGAVVAKSPRQVADEADIVMMCLTAAPAVREVVFGAEGVAETKVKGKRLVDFSSMRPDLTREWAAELRRKNGMGWVDAPVSGGVPGAEKGTLAIMAGGEQADFDAVKEMASRARAENERLAERVAALEAELASLSGKAQKTADDEAGAAGESTAKPKRAPRSTKPASE